MTTWAELGRGDFRHYARLKDGRKFVDGAEDALAAVPFSYDAAEEAFRLEPGHVFDEVLIAPRHMDPAELVAIVNLGGPLTDAASVIDAAARNVTAGHALLNGDGLAVYDEAAALQVVAGDARGLPNVPAGAAYGLWAGGAFMDASGLSVANAAGQAVVKLGNIAGRPGVPAGVTHGLHGELGTGVYIRGALRLEEIGEANAQVTMSSMTAGEVRGSAVGNRHYIRSGPFTVPAGEVWYVMAALSAVLPSSGCRLIQASAGPIAPVAGTGGSVFRTDMLTPDDYDELYLSFGIMVEARTAGTHVHNVWARYFIVKAIQ